MRGMLRALHLAVYAALAALGMALVARPAVLWLRGLGLFGPALPWEIPLGPAFAAVGVMMIACTLALAVRLSLRRVAGRGPHAALLLVVAAALAIRGAAGQPRRLTASARLQARPQVSSSVSLPPYPEARVLTR